MNINTLLAAYQEAIQQLGSATPLSEVILWNRKDTANTATVLTAAGMWSLRVTYEKIDNRERWTQGWVAYVVTPEGVQHQGIDAEFQRPFFLCWEDAELWCEQQLGFASTPRMLTESDIAAFRAEGRRVEGIVAVHYHDVAHYTDDDHWIVLTHFLGRDYERYDISIDAPEVIGGKGSLMYLQVRQSWHDEDDTTDDQ